MKPKRHRAIKLTNIDKAFLDGLLEAHDDLPDGAWQAACEDAIAECGGFEGQDPYEVWLEWAISKSEQQQ